MHAGLPISSVAIYVGLLLMIGVVVLRWRVLTPGDETAVHVRAARLGGLAGALLCVGLVGAFLAQLAAYHMPGDSLVRDARVLVHLPWGRAWSAQAILALVATRTFLTAPGKDSAPRDLVASVLVMALAFTPAFTGHAHADLPKGLAVVADGIHVLAAGAWVGTLAAVLASVSWSRDAAVMASAPWPGDGAVLLARIRRFSPIALWAAPVVAVTGLTSTWLRLTHVSDLWVTGYGRWLFLKIVLFLGVIALGWFNWRQATGRLEESGDTEAIRGSARSELLMALAVLVATAFLLAMPLPVEG